MAFISMIFVYFIGFCILLGLGIAPIIAGTILYHKTERKKLGIALRILGYVMLIPMLIFGLAVLTAIFWRVS
ncbi:MAG: hypothetical protein IJ642_13455 [Oscillospiraceae bacterium]|nr:hypothetical protein [Oscillospiraceae bacterium]